MKVLLKISGKILMALLSSSKEITNFHATQANLVPRHYNNANQQNDEAKFCCRSK